MKVILVILAQTPTHWTRHKKQMKENKDRIVGKAKRICVIGNFSGRNAGDIAILGNVINDIAAIYPEGKFIIPTINPDFIQRSFPGSNVKAVSLQPWALSIKIFGLPIFRTVLQSDLVLVTDNILFDLKLFNPIFNYLSTLSLVLPLARRRNIPVILYNMSLGPITTRMGKSLFERVIRSSDLIILRDTQSKDLLDRLGIPHGPIEFRADSALNSLPCQPERLQEIIERETLFQNEQGTIGFNINAYLDAYLSKNDSGTNQAHFSTIIAETVDRLIDETGVDVLFIITQVMDVKINTEVISKIKNKTRIKLVSNRDYSYQDLTGLMERLELLVGMRTHALILASSVGTPVVGIISYPKTEGFLRSIQQNQWTIPFRDLEVESLFGLVFRAYNARMNIKETLLPAVELEKEKARNSALFIQPYLSGALEGGNRTQPVKSYS